ncbi:MAG: VPS10 domain-containing protein [Candidatus Saccharicenans sp.]|nr:MAG: glycosyl hydrolase [Candidatus Aminicenantes bacterium]HEK86341.1 glycosyl hydrolase [Candidatus Aminicenantes bacterium]
MKQKRNKVIILVLLSIAVLSLSGLGFSYTTADQRLASWELHKKMAQESWFRMFEWKNLGPYFMGGRICDIQGYASNPLRVIVAAASGGLWLTENNGTTWRPLFDNESSIGFGDVAIYEKDPNLIWAGTGEENSSRSSYAGTGVFKSTDGGKTWQHMGLADTHHIAEIIIHPENPDIVYVAAIGHLYTENTERGVFKTTDGGKTWQKVLYVSSKTGVISLAMDPSNPEVLYAATWERLRQAWNMQEAGRESAIYKTEDGGQHWRKIVNGFPQNEYVGRIGLAISPSNPKVIYAFLDNQEPRTPIKKPAGAKEELTVEAIKKMTVKDFLKIEDGKLETLLRQNKAPMTFNSKSVKEAVQNGKLSLNDLADILIGGAEAALFNTQVKGAEVYRSDDGGEHWRKTHEGFLSNSIVNTYGYYFGQIYVSPEDENVVYILGVPLMKSTDGGKTFKEIPENGGSYGYGYSDVHPDNHALWINPKDPRIIWLGNDGGLNVSYDAGQTFQRINNLPLAQCYTISFDYETPYNIYTGLQDNGVNVGPRDFVYGRRDKDWKMILGGDGGFVEPSLYEKGIVYAEFQFGSLFRLNLNNPKENKMIKPQLKTVEPPYRFNWLTPFFISRHNPFTLVLGANKVLKSVDRGDNWVEISPDLTDRKNITGDVPYATITALTESPFTPEVIYAGTDDGNVWVTKNGGCSWEKIIAGLPKKWVTRIEVSSHQPGRVYLTMIGYREDDFSTYVYASEDYGKTWVSIKNNLPDEGCNVIREDPVNENVIYLGTDLTVYVSLDRGQSWQSLRANLPTQPVYDLKIQPREKELIIGTHGRGVFVLPVQKIEQMTPQVLAKELYVFEPDEVSLPAGRREVEVGPEPQARFLVYAKTDGSGQLAVKDLAGKVLKEMEVQFKAGLNEFTWDLKPEGQKIRVKPGDYQVEVSKGQIAETKKFKVMSARMNFMEFETDD